MKRIPSSMLVAALLVAMVGTATPQATHAQDTPSNVVIFVIDLSGSMNEDFAAQQTKLDAAKDAFTRAFRNAAGVGGDISVRVYGDQFPSRPPAERQQNCTEDTRSLVPLGDLSETVDDVVGQINGLDAQGDTPIGLALQAAAEDIPEGSLGTIVLFSDGRDECVPFDLGPDPCEVAQALKDRSIEVQAGLDRVETVGLLPDDAADTELQCIADETGGTYTPIRTEEDLVQAEELLTDLAAPRQAVRLGGTTLSGTTGPDGAPVLSDISGGTGPDIYLDNIVAGEERWYHAPEYGPGSADLTATIFDLPAREGITFSLTLEPGPDVNASPLERTLDNAGIPRAPSASIRCPGCSYSSGDGLDLFVVISLESQEELVGEFDLELQIAGPAFRGEPTNCQEPQECYYAGEQLQVEQDIEEAEAAIEEAPDQASQDQIDRRDELAAERDELETELAATNEAEPDTNWIPVIVAALVVAGLAALVVGLRRRRPKAEGVIGDA